MRVWLVVCCACAVAACGDDASTPRDAATPADVAGDADVTAPTVTLLGSATPFALLTEQTLAWRTDEAGTWQATLGGTTLATGTAVAGDTISATVIGAQLSATAPTELRVDVTDAAGNVGSAGTSLILEPAVLIPNSVVNSFELVVRPDGKRVYVTSYDTAKVLVIDADPASPSNNTVLTEISVGTQPCGLAITADGSRLYVGEANGIAVIATASNTVTTTINVTGLVSGLAIGKGERLYAATNQNAFRVVDIAPTSATYHQLIGTFARQLMFSGRWGMNADGSRGVLAWSGVMAYTVEILDLDPASSSYGSKLFTPVPLIPGPAPGPGVAVTSTGVAYTAILGANSTTPLGAITIASGATGPTYAGVFHAQGSVGLAGGYLLHSGLASNALQVIRASDLSFVGALPLGAAGELLGSYIAIAPDGSRAWLQGPGTIGHYMVPLK